MFRKLDLAIAAVPELAKYADMISGTFSELAKVKGPIQVQRVHGDYHLGQVLRTETGWVVLDFEGEPATPLAQRRARSSPLRDVAGMLRSFDYAAGSWEQAHPGRSAAPWAAAAREAFLDGYAQASGRDPRADAALLEALEVDKALYEVVYEARNRPTWLTIPTTAIARLVNRHKE